MFPHFFSPQSRHGHVYRWQGHVLKNFHTLRVSLLQTIAPPHSQFAFDAYVEGLIAGLIERLIKGLIEGLIKPRSQAWRGSGNTWNY